MKPEQTEIVWIEEFRAHPSISPFGPSFTRSGNICDFRIQDDGHEAKVREASAPIIFHKNVHLERTDINTVIPEQEVFRITPFRSPCTTFMPCKYMTPRAISINYPKGQRVANRLKADMCIHQGEFIRLWVFSKVLGDIPVVHPLRDHDQFRALHIRADKVESVWI